MPALLVFTVTDQPRHVGADRAMAALLGAFAFATVVFRHARGPVVTFYAGGPYGEGGCGRPEQPTRHPLTGK